MAMDTVNFGRALYYPHIFPQSRRWLRTAALYHDGIGRIVPRDFIRTAYDRHGGAELLEDFEALQAAGFIEDNHPNDYLYQVGAQFFDFLAPLLGEQGRKDRLRKQLSSRDWKPYNMFREKISPDLVELLEQEDLARKVGDYEIEFDASIGGLYMLFLAREMAKQQPIVSDNPTFETLAGLQIKQVPTGAIVDRGIILANAIFRSAVPVDIEAVKIDDLIQFRNDHADERVAFYESIASLRADLAKINDPKQLDQAVEHHRAGLERRMLSLETKLKTLKLKCLSGIFTVSVPGILTARWGLNTKNHALIVGGGTLALAGIVAGSVLNHISTRADSPLSYVHSLRADLKPKEYAKGIISLKLNGI